MLMALTREISSAITRCELMYLTRAPIDLALARAQHVRYEACLADAGCCVMRIAADTEMPDSVFIEDTAIVVAELAIITRPGAASRRVETPAVAEALGRHRPIARIETPGTMDVLVVGDRVFVGISSRTNSDAARQLRAILAPHGYSVEEIAVRGCLHLKSAVTCIGENLLLMNPAWLPANPFASFDHIEVDPREPMAANAASVGDQLILAAAFPHTRERLQHCGLQVRAIDVSELAKAEGALTCCSLICESEVLREY
jgi:dimethylargininase